MRGRIFNADRASPNNGTELGSMATYRPLATNVMARWIDRPTIDALGIGNLFPTIMVPQVKTGAIKVVAVTGPAREAELPDVPTMAEARFPSLECESWFGIAVGPGTPRDVITTLNHQVTAVLAVDDVRRRLAALSLEPRRTTSAEFRQFVEREHGRWGPVLSEIGIKLD